MESMEAREWQPATSVPVGSVDKLVGVKGFAPPDTEERRGLQPYRTFACAVDEERGGLGWLK